VFVPLLASSPDETTALEAARPPPAAAPRAHRTAAPSVSARHAASEPHEVQIHIGRIEVTAVPPAPANAPVARPRRSATSLDEYLRRRNGRAP
jgi:hypothetical protein